LIKFFYGRVYLKNMPFNALLSLKLVSPRYDPNSLNYFPSGKWKYLNSAESKKAARCHTVFQVLSTFG
jgi:hypothetical protein